MANPGVAISSNINIVPVQTEFDTSGNCLGLIGPAGSVFYPPTTFSNVLNQPHIEVYDRSASIPLTGTASFASKAGQLINTLTLGNGLTGTSFDGSANVTATVGAGALIGVGSGITYVQTSSLTTNQIPKLVSNTLSGSNISDDGTTVTISKATTISAEIEMAAEVIVLSISLILGVAE